MTTAAGAPMGDYRLVPSIDAVLKRVAAQARDTVGRCQSAGVMVVEAGAVTGRGCTDGVAHDLDRTQCEAGEGPCMDALRFLQIFNVPWVPDVQEWPAFRDVADRHGVLSSLFVPLSLGGRALGTLNLYSRTRNGFEDCEQVAMDFASRSAAALVRVQLQEKS